MNRLASSVFVALFSTCVAVGAAKRFEGLPEEIAAIAEKSPSVTLGVAVKDLSTGETAGYQSARVFPQVGALRLHLLFELFRQSAAGRIDAAQIVPLPASSGASGPGILRHLPSTAMSLHDYAVLMILLNDNTAANLLAERLTIDALTASAQKLGLAQTRFEALPARPERETLEPAERNRRTSSPQDMLLSLEHVYAGKLVDRARSDEVLRILALPKPSALRPEFPREVSIAGVGVSGQLLRSECAIVARGKTAYIVCVMMDRPRDSTEADRVFASTVSAVAKRLSFPAATP